MVLTPVLITIKKMIKKKYLYRLDQFRKRYQFLTMCTSIFNNNIYPFLVRYDLVHASPDPSYWRIGMSDEEVINNELFIFYFPNLTLGVKMYKRLENSTNNQNIL
jgi:hypothetical protein